MTPSPTIAHYKIISKPGEGGMGVVWRATGTRLGREVAVKVLPDGYTAGPDRLAACRSETRLRQRGSTRRVRIWRETPRVTSSR